MPQGPIPVRVVNSAAVGNSWFVNEATGNDGNNGSAAGPFKTLDAAQNAAKANNNDVVYLQGSSHRTSTLAWAKDGVSLVGLAAPSDNDRARISQTGLSVFSPLVNVTAAGCSFVNLGTFHGFDDASTQICWEELGGRNFYSNVQFLGMGHATAAAQAGGRSLVVGGSGENLFVGCTFGLDTIVRASAANATLELVGGTPRNTIRTSIFQSECTDASDLHVLIASNGMDRYLLLDDVTFLNFGSAINAVVSNAGGSPGGIVILTPSCVSVGAAAIATGGEVYGPIGALGATTWGIAGHLT